MARNVGMTHTHVSMDRWIIVTESGRTRVSNTFPSIKADEIAIALKITLPRSVFRKPTLQANITVADGEPVTVSPDLKNQVAEALRGTGLVVEVVAKKGGA